MPTITGTSGDDLLEGTWQDDLLVSNGGADMMSGFTGADTYHIRQGGTSTSAPPTSVVISDLGTDAALDTITGARGLFHSASFGYARWATAEQVGDDLLLELPGRPYRFRKPPIAQATIEIKGQFSGTGVERIEMQGVTYALPDGPLGSDLPDILAGSFRNDVLRGLAGDDFICANGGNDRVYAGDGADIVFGGAGRNMLDLGAGDDRAWGGEARDIIKGRGGQDRIDAGGGNNKVLAGGGDDTVTAGSGNDVIFGGAGNDVLTGGDGDNKLYGGKGYDVLSVGVGTHHLSGGKQGDDYLISVAGPGSTVIDDNGSRASGNFYATGTFDDVILGAYGFDGAVLRGLDLSVSGDDLLLRYLTADMAGPVEVTLTNQMLNGNDAMERIGFGSTVENARMFNIAYLSGDNRTYSVHYGADQGADDIVLGTDGDDLIYSGFGTNIVMGGAGADRFMYGDEDDNRGGFDLIRDFDLAEDKIDFTEIGALGASDLTITQGAYGNVVISSIYVTIELVGISADQITVDHPLFLFKAQDLPDPDPAPDPDPDPAPVPMPTPLPGATPHYGTAAADILKGGDGVDQFIFHPDTAFAAIDQIKDFEPGSGDLLDVSALLIGYDPDTDLLADFVQIMADPDENRVILAVDRDGAGGSHEVTAIATLEDLGTLTLAQLEADGAFLL